MREECLMRLLRAAARKYGEPEIARMPIDTNDRGNRSERRKVYSMAYEVSKPQLKRLCGPDWTFVSWGVANIDSYASTRDDIILSSEKEPELDKAGWMGNIRSPREDAPESRTRPLLLEVAAANPEIMEATHVFPPSPRNPSYMPMDALVRRYRALIDLGGQGYSGRLKYLLFSRRPVIMAERNFVEYFHDDLRPWIHFVPAKMDLSDIVEKVRWTLDNKKEAREIAENALNFAAESFKEERLLERVRDVWEAMKC